MANQTDEIEITELLRACLSFLNKNKWILLIVFCIGLVLGYFKNKQRTDSSNAYYRTQFIVKSDYLDNDQIYMEARTLSFQIDDAEKIGKALSGKIKHVEVTKDVIEGQEPEINIVFETSVEVEVSSLQELIVKRIETNASYKMNYSLSVEHYNKQLTALKSVKNEDEATSVDNPKKTLEYVKLLEKEQELEFKMMKLKEPIQCLAIAPTNFLYPAPGFSIVLIISYGIILTLFTGLVIWCLGFLKKALRN